MKGTCVAGGGGGRRSQCIYFSFIVVKKYIIKLTSLVSSFPNMDIRKF